MHNLTIEEIKKQLSTTQKGISSAEAEIRGKRDGKNIIEEGRRVPGILKFLKQFKNVLIIILIAASILSFTVGIIEQRGDEFLDAALIWVVIIVNAIIGFIQEGKAEKAVNALKNATKPFSKVMRDGKIVKIKTEDLVAGDVVYLEAGDVVPADLRLFEAARLQIEESALTGESLPVSKHTDVIESEKVVPGDMRNMAFFSGIVTYGRGKGIVVATGMKTEMGKIAQSLKEQKYTETPLTKRLHKTNIMISILVALVAVAIFITRAARGEEIISSLMTTIAIAVCAIPEALPTAITITLALGMQRMSLKKAIIRHMPAVETLGSTEIICSDKTGTLTLNKMTVKRFFIIEDGKGTVYDMDKQEIELIDQHNSKENFKKMMNCMLLCNDSQTRYENGILSTIGDPTETALVHFSHQFGFSKEYAEEKYPRVDEVPFDSDRKMMSTVHRMEDGVLMFTKGGDGMIVRRCTQILDGETVRPLTEDDRQQIRETAKVFAKKALRVLGYAYKICESSSACVKDEEDLIFIGLTGMIDPPRPEVVESIRICKEAGILPIMITGDHKETAFAIAKEIGIAEKESQVMTGMELAEFSDAELSKIIENYRVFARVSPEHKTRLVLAYKAQNKVVAMTGDGVNDAPSIKAADIGIGMGINGTDVTKEASDVILTDDNFATIVGAVEEGRRTFGNIIKIITYLFGLSLAELVLLTVFSFTPLRFFSPLLILWINIVTDTFPVLALGTLEADGNVMRQKPNTARGSLFKGHVGEQILVSAFFMTFLCGCVYLLSYYVFLFDPVVCVTMTYLTLAIIETVHGYNLYNRTESVFKVNPLRNKWMNLAVMATAVIVVASIAIPFPAFQDALKITTLNGMQWGIGIAFGMLMVPLMEFYKIYVRAVDKRRSLKLSGMLPLKAEKAKKHGSRQGKVIPAESSAAEAKTDKKP